MTNFNLTCEEFDAALPDYLEESLEAGPRSSIERHLGECVRCASLVRDLEKIRVEAAALPDLLPSRDLWAGIEDRIAAPVIALAPRVERQKRFAPWMAAAAAALIVSTAGITYLVTARSISSAPAVGRVAAQAATAVNATRENESPSPQDSPGSEASSPASETNINSVRGSAVREVAGGNPSPTRVPGARLVTQIPDYRSSHSEAVYSKEIAMLQKILTERRTQLDPSTVTIIERNLGIIDAAIEQSKAALAKDPASLLLSEQLTHALDKKVELLRTAAMLPAST
jgi:hypothetical protein